MTEEETIKTGQLPEGQAEEVLKNLDAGSYNPEGDIVPKKTEIDSGDERKDIMWGHYVQSVFEGRPNAVEAARKAGYEESYCNNITNQKWFKDRSKKLNRAGLLNKAEENLRKILTMPYISMKTKGGEQIMEVDTDVLRLILDASKVIVKSLGKDEGYSERSEVTGKGGEPIVFMPAELLSKHGLNK